MGKKPLPPPHVSPQLFARWRSPRRGAANPQRMNNPVWEWLIETRLNAFQAAELFNAPSACDVGPGWCFDRFGQSVTDLPDGRRVLVAGEHEDYYDPDFYIYNDLVVIAECGEVDIYGYPTEVFPPTDFQTATLVDGGLVVIGNIGYSHQRRPGHTQVIRFDCETWSATRVDCVGEPPGWIHEHRAELEEGGRGVLVSGGKVHRGRKATNVENIDEWRLNLEGWCWERLTARNWMRFEVRRQDRKLLSLFDLGMLEFEERMGWHETRVRSNRKELEEELGGPLRLELLPDLYRPPISHRLIPSEDDDFGTHRIRIAGVVVRYVEDKPGVQVTVEGDLPAETISELRRDLIDKLEAIEHSSMVCRAILRT